MSPLSPSSKASSRPPLRVGLVGVTGYGLAYYEGLTKLVESGLVEWGAATIINRAEATEQLAFFEATGVPVYDDYRAMLEAEGERLDWVCVPTAIGWHTRMTVDSLRRGIPVLVEKPIAPTLQDVDAIQAAERESGLLVAVGFQHSYIRGTWEIKRRLLAGEIGEIRRMDSIGLWPRPESYYTRNDWSGRIHDGQFWVLDSPLQNALSHVVNLILFFGGSTLEGRADLREVAAELYRAKPIQSYDTVRTEVTLDSGVRAAVVLSHSSAHRIDPEIRIVGSKGTFTWRFSGAHTFKVGDRIETLRTRGHIPMRDFMFENIVRRIQGDPSGRICTTELAKGEVKWVNAVQDATAIHDIPAVYRRHLVEESGEVFDFVENLDYYAVRAYHERCWFSDLNAPWAVAPGRLDTTAYTRFEARHIPAPVPPVESSAR
ncbi:MAG: Gfo/Idh/MocA family protein [Verrucomicrobiota bacterium]